MNEYIFVRIKCAMAQLQVTIIAGRNLKKKDFFSESDPFVQVYLDDKKQKQKTTVQNNTKNPQWNQSFVLYYINCYYSINRFLF